MPPANDLPHRHRSSRRTLLAAALGGIALCCGGGYLGWQWLIGWDDDPFGDVTQLGPDQLASVADAAHLHLPGGTTWLAGYYYYWQEWVLSVRLQLPQDGLAEFVNGSGLPQPAPGLRPSQVMQPNHPASKHDEGWHPDRPAQVSGIYRHEVDRVFRELMFDLDGHDAVTAYIIAGDAT